MTLTLRGRKADKRAELLSYSISEIMMVSAKAKLNLTNLSNNMQSVLKEMMEQLIPLKDAHLNSYL